MGMHVRRHGWRHFAPPLSFGLALSVKMNSDLVVDAISSQDIGQLRDESVLDLSTPYQLSSGLQVSNLTDEPLRMHRDNESNRIGRDDEYGRRYLFDVTTKF